MLYSDASSSSANVDEHFHTTCRKKRVKVVYIPVAYVISTKGLQV